MHRSQLAVLADGTRIEPSLEQPESSRAANFGHSSNSVTPAAVMVPLSPPSPHTVSDAPCDLDSMEHQRSGNNVMRESCVFLLKEACALPPQCSQLSRPSVEKSICVGSRLSPAFIDCLSQLLLVLRRDFTAESQEESSVSSADSRKIRKPKNQAVLPVTSLWLLVLSLVQCKSACIHGR